MPRRLSTFDLVEAFQLAHAVSALHEAGVLTALETPTPVGTIADGHGFDVGVLRLMLEYVADRTQLLDRNGDAYVTNKHYGPGARALIDQYIGAYGPNARATTRLLRDLNGAAELVDRKRHADAFEQLPGPGLAMLPEILRRLELGAVLDLGCGPGALLADLAVHDPSFEGWGLDANPQMCEAARRRLALAGVGDRVTIFEADVGALSAEIPSSVLGRVRTVTAASLLNGFFWPDEAPAVAWAQHLRAQLPGRLLVVVDYYGRLGKHEGPLPRPIALHDYVQLLSGQGVPPPDLSGWRHVYEAAGCALVHAIEDPQADRFVHLVRL